MSAVLAVLRHLSELVAKHPIVVWDSKSDPRSRRHLGSWELCMVQSARWWSRSARCPVAGRCNLAGAKHISPLSRSARMADTPCPSCGFARSGHCLEHIRQGCHHLEPWRRTGHLAIASRTLRRGQELPLFHEMALGALRKKVALGSFGVHEKSTSAHWCRGSMTLPPRHARAGWRCATHPTDRASGKRQFVRHT